MDKKEAIIERIKKLMKHSASAASIGSEQEAQAFAKKATELLLEYNLTEEEVSSAADKTDADEFKNYGYTESISYADNQSGSRWKLELVRTLAKYNLCKFYINEGKKTFVVYGDMQNVDVVIWLYNFLNIGLLRVAQQHHVDLPDGARRSINRYAYLKNFLLGAVKGIDLQLDTQRHEQFMKAGMHQMVVRNDAKLQKYQEQALPFLRTSKAKPVKIGLGYSEGVEAGKNYSITKPLSSTPKTAGSITKPTKRLS